MSFLCFPEIHTETQTELKPENLGSFSFLKKNEEFDPNLVIISCDKKELFTNTPLKESIGLWVEDSYRNHI